MDYKKYFEKGVSFKKYLESFEKQAKDKNHEFAEYLPVNLSRTKRILKRYLPSNSLLAELNTRTEPLNWLVITEDWCGDSAQVLPVIAKIAEESKGIINLKIVYRDQNTELIDQHLTNKGRSIPKLIALNDSDEVINDWGPRPKSAQDLVLRIKENAETFKNYANDLHKWYAKDKQQEIEKELREFITSTLKEEA